METWFLNRVLGLTLSVLLLLGLPGPLGAGTPGSNSSDPATAGFYPATPAGEVGDAENNRTSTSYDSESLSPSQRNLLLTHAAETHAATVGSFDNEEMQTYTETSSRSLETTRPSTEPLNSTLVVAVTEASSSSGSSDSSSSSGTSSSSSSSSSSTDSSSSSSGGTSSSSSSSSTDSSTSGSSSSSSSSGGSSTDSGTSGSSSSSSSGGSSTDSGSSSSSGGGSSTDSSTSGTSSSSTSGGSSTDSGTSGSSSSSSSSSGGGGGGSSPDSSTSGTSGSSSTSGGGSSTDSGTSSSSSSSSSSGGSSTDSSTSGTSGTSGSSGSSSSSMDWKDNVNTDQVPDVSSAMPWEARSWMSTEDASLPQDGPDSALWPGDSTALVSQTAVHTDSTYTSTTVSRAGERTLLSVTSSFSNSTSSAITGDSNSHQPPSTSGTETEDYTHSALSMRTDSRGTTDQHITPMFSETGSPGGSRGTQSLTGLPNATQHQHTSASEETSDSTPPLKVTELSTDQSEVSVSISPPVTSSTGGSTNVSGTDLESGSNADVSTESSTAGHSSSTQNQGSTEGLSSHTGEDNMNLGLTTAPPTVSNNTSEPDDSLTYTPVLVTEIFLTTTSDPDKERSQMTEEDTFRASASTTINTPSLPTTSSSRFSSATSSSTSELKHETSISYTTPSTTASTPALQTTTVHPTPLVSPSQTQGPSTVIANPTSVTPLQIEASTRTQGVTTPHHQYVPTTYTHSTPTGSTEVLHTPGQQTERRTTELVVTTSPTDIQPTKAPPPPRNTCVSNPCMNGGMCVSYKGDQYTCHCQQAWAGPNCNQDVDECEKDPCPPGSRCVNTRGSFGCECPLGFDLEDGRTCTTAKTFLGTFSVNRPPHDPDNFKSATIHEIQREIIQLLNASLSVLRGYTRSTLSKKEEDGVHISAVNMFSISTDVTRAEVDNSIQMSLSNCSSSMAHCRMVLHHQLTYHGESLCVAQKTQCDTERSTCTDRSGTAHCQCLQGYYKHDPDDLSCLECGDGYKLENGTCVPCMFGFGGFNCGNFYKLIAVVVSPAGGVLLLILVIALIVTCCKKDKNDINKIIFKSGDLQMSPYADFPKNNRISMEWGRETIEMQENGSTKNLLQMTDIYYSPALRNSDLERNGLYPFTGLPGSRHSCIYPAQWNPSFISDDSRRRDYF